MERAGRAARTPAPGVALIDYKLDGGKDGIMVARQLRQLGTKIVYMTASADEVRLIDSNRDRSKAISRGRTAAGSRSRVEPAKRDG